MSDLDLILPHMVLVGTALLVLLVEAFGRGDRRPEATWLSLLGIAAAALTTGAVNGNMLTATASAPFGLWIRNVMKNSGMIIGQTTMKSAEEEPIWLGPVSAPRPASRLAYTA